MSEQKLRLGHPYVDAKTLRQPRRESEMIGMQMSNDDALHRPSREVVGEDLLPESLGDFATKAGIHDDPAVAVAQQPEIDVIEGKRQRHAQPVDAVGDLQQPAGVR